MKVVCVNFEVRNYCTYIYEKASSPDMTLPSLLLILFSIINFEKLPPSLVI